MLFVTVLLVIAMLDVAADPFLIAHRGASGEAPENTLPAFELAWKQGADAIECDVHLTRDGQIVCHHDADTRKRGGRELVIADSALAQLRALDVGRWKHARFAGTRIPTLAEALATVPEGKRAVIEVKCGPEIVPKLLTAVAASELADAQLMVIAFDAEVIAAVRRRRPAWTANWLYAFDRRQPRAPELELARVIQTCRRVGAHGLGSNPHPGLRAAHVARLREAGLAHHVWTVDDPATARRFLAMGTRSITTNVPGRLRQALSERR